MDKRYQVFVSSTFEDLREERQEVMHALLELDCIPAGMELFSAANEDQWSLIKKVIAECDYYVLVLGARYGSMGLEGKSFTEMEYRYAIEIGKPVVAFLHKDPSQISTAKSEKTDAGKKQLEEFRALVQTKLCKFWSSPAELGSVVSRSIVKLIKTAPTIGWIRADQTFDAEATSEILKLKRTIEQLEGKLQQARHAAPAGSDLLSQGNEEISISFKFETTDKERKGWRWDYEIELSWDELFYDIGPIMLNEASDTDFRNALSHSVRERSRRVRLDDKDLTGHTAQVNSFVVSDHDFQTVKIQFIALGLVAKSQKTRSVKDSRTFWALTPYGDQALTRLRAVRRGPSLKVPETQENS